MKNSLHYTYCTLLFVSLLSSCLLFILVASEEKPLKASSSIGNTDTKKGRTSATRIKTTNHISNGFSSKRFNSFEEILKRSQERRRLLRNKKNVFKEVVPPDLIFLDALSKNVGITNNLLKELPGSPSVITLVDTKEDLKLENKLEEDIQVTLENITNNFTSLHKDEEHQADQTEDLAEHPVDSIIDEFEKMQEERKEAENDTAEPPVAVKEGKPEVNLTEENPIPVFSEWTQKQMEEAQKKKGEVVNASTMKKQTGSKSQPMKLRAKNYAAPDCGAKILASNQEAQSTASVLTAPKDEYLLNPCTSRIWFVVELCEPIQAERIELANFELFSSSPKDFTIGVANRFPTRDWSSVGQFTAKDERDVQSFDLHPRLFGKFIRVDIHSHYNSEHFCPVSLFRVYGTSEFEAFETDNQPNANEDDDLEDEDDEDESSVIPKENIVNMTKKGKDQNLLKSAGEAVMNIVKKAAEVLVKNNEINETQIIENIKKEEIKTENCICLVHEIKCENCPIKLKEKVTNVLECQYDFISTLLEIDLINHQLEKYQNLCANILGDKICEDITLKQRKSFLNMLPEHYVAGLCNVRAFNKKTNVSHDVMQRQRSSEKVVTKSEPIVLEQAEQPSIGQQVDNSKLAQIQETDVKQVEAPETSVPAQTTGSLAIDESCKIDEDLNDVNIFNVVDNSVVITDPMDVGDALKDEAQPTVLSSSFEKVELWDTIDENLLDQQIDTPSSSNQLVQQSQKVQPESVFLRLSNRIKALERNMSLSGQYLEELSRRYKKQVEELQHSLTKTLSAIEEQNKQNIEREQYLREENIRLRQELYDFVETVTNWQNIVFYAGFLICIQVILMYTFLKNCPKNSSQDLAIEEIPTSKKIKKKTDTVVRRMSVDDMAIVSVPSSLKVRRPSEEALNITGTYSDLLISESNDQIGDFIKKKKKKDKHRKISAPQLSQPKSCQALVVRPSIEQKMDLVRSESVPERDIPSPSTLNTPILTMDRIEQVALEDNDEFILPSASGFAYDEFVPNSTSEPIENINGSVISSSSSMDSKSTARSKFTRRLSSPKIGLFLRNSISRKSERAIDENENDDPGQVNQWYKLKKSSSHEKTKRKSKSESPISLNGFNGNTTPPSMSQKKSGGGSFKSART